MPTTLSVGAESSMSLGSGLDTIGSRGATNARVARCVRRGMGVTKISEGA